MFVSNRLETLFPHSHHTHCLWIQLTKPMVNYHFAYPSLNKHPNLLQIHRSIHRFENVLKQTTTSNINLFIKFTNLLTYLPIIGFCLCFFSGITSLITHFTLGILIFVRSLFLVLINKFNVDITLRLWTGNHISNTRPSATRDKNCQMCVLMLSVRLMFIWSMKRTHSNSVHTNSILCVRTLVGIHVTIEIIRFSFRFVQTKKKKRVSPDKHTIRNCIYSFSLCGNTLYRLHQCLCDSE